MEGICHEEYALLSRCSDDCADRHADDVVGNCGR
jgi:hypothetical protein